MKSWQVGGIVVGAVVAIAGVTLAATNPNQEKYEAFATEQLTGYLGEEVCAKAPDKFGLRSQCEVALQDNRDAIQQLIQRQTQRRNFLFFSLYTTELGVHPLLPSFHVETVGLFNQFHIYQAEPR